MYEFLDASELPKLTKEDINHLNNSKTSNKIKAPIKSLPKKRSPGPNRFTTEYYQTFKDRLTVILLKLCHGMQREITLTN
jgi:hypothetical protein